MKALPVNAGRILLFVSLILLAGCQSMAPNPVVPTVEPTMDLNVVRTEAVGTAMAAITSEAKSLPTATLEPTQPQDTPTQPPAPTATTAPAVATQAPVVVVVTATKAPVVGGPVLPTKTVYTDSAKFVSQTPADNKTYKPGAQFDISWTIQNVGLRAWNTQFYFKHISGPNSPKGGDMHMLTSSIAVRDSITLTIDMTAPNEPGIYIVKWGLINDDGVTFYSFFYSFAVAN